MHEHSREYSLEERLQLPDYEIQDDVNVHLASVAEKKHLWWRNAVINTFFIASWCVNARP
jgi:hypothetical protein